MKTGAARKDVAMRVTETTLQELVGGPKQFRVPLFQRTYTWKERDHAQLWRDILAQYELSRPGAASTNGQDGHFIGSFCSGPDARSGHASGIPGGGWPATSHDADTGPVRPP